MQPDKRQARYSKRRFCVAGVVAVLMSGGLSQAAIHYVDDGGVVPDLHANGFQFEDTDRWSSTGTDGGGLGQGQPTTLLWSFVPDGTAITAAFPSESNNASSLIAFLDGLLDPGMTGGADLTQRLWYSRFDSPFERIEDVSGLTLTYEASDNGNAPNKSAADGRDDCRSSGI